MDEPVWLLRRVVLALHEESLAEHGGLPGIRDEGLLDSALARPENLFAYGEPDLCDLAAAYAFGLAKNHPFADGNKRTSFEACDLFLTRNGLALPVDDEANIATWMALAAGTLGKADLAAWLRARVRQFFTEVAGEGDVVQRELIERGPVPTIHGDGWEFEGIVDGMAHMTVFAEHVRDDGETVRVVQGRLTSPPEVLLELLRRIAATRGETADDVEG